MIKDYDQELQMFTYMVVKFNDLKIVIVLLLLFVNNDFSLLRSIESVLTLHAPELHLYRTQCTRVRPQSHIFLLLLILHKTTVPEPHN